MNTNESKYSVFGKAVANLIKKISDATKDEKDEIKKADTRRVAILSELPGVISSYLEVIISPTADDIALLSCSSVTACAAFKARMEAPERDRNAASIHEVNAGIQRYLKYKATMLVEEKGKNEVLALVSDNMK